MAGDGQGGDIDEIEPIKLEPGRRDRSEEGGTLDCQHVHQDVQEDAREHREDDGPVDSEGDIDAEDPAPCPEEDRPLEDPGRAEGPRKPQEQGMRERAVVEEPQLRGEDRDRRQEGIEVRRHGSERHGKGDLSIRPEDQRERDGGEDVGEPVHGRGIAVGPKRPRVVYMQYPPSSPSLD